MEKIILSLGGSVVNPGELNIGLIKKLSKILIKSKQKYGIVVGGGWLARKMVLEGKKLSTNQDYLDDLGINSTRVNAQAVLGYFIEKKQKVYPKICLTVEEAEKKLKKYNFVFMGGTAPGHTTDYVAVKLAEKCKAKKVVNISNVDGIYTADPKYDKTATKIPEMSLNDLYKMMIKEKFKPGQNLIFDQKATVLAKRNKTELHFIGSINMGDIIKIIKGKKHRGTTVK